MRKIISIFMIVLIISLPIAFAQIIVHEVTVNGEDDVDGVLRRYDHLDIEAVVSIEGDTDLTNNVYYGNVGPFDCSEGSSSVSNAFNCRYNTDSSPRVAQQHSFKIYLYTDLQPYPQPYSQEYSGAYIVDGFKPVVEEFNIKEELTSKSAVTAEFVVRDTAYRGSTKCSGINKLEIYDKKGSSLVDTFINEQEGCIWYGEDNIDLAGKSGNLELCVKAHDRFGQSLSKVGEYDICDTVTVDSDPVRILTNSWKLIDTNNLPITHFRDYGIAAIFSINISGEDLVNPVVGDFHELNEEREDEYKEMPTDCTDTVKPEIKKCEWHLEVKLSEGGTKTITINATDRANNGAFANINIPLSYDDVGPEVVSLTTGATDGNILFARSSGNTFTADIREDGIGLRKDDVVLHLGSVTRRATSCEKPANWVCEWDNIGISGNREVKAYIGADSKDRLGNPFTKSDEYDVVVDNTRTVVNDIIIEQGPPVNNIEVIPGKIKTGDMINIIANLTEANGIRTAIGNFGVIAADKIAEQGTCTAPVNDIVICTWSGIQITQTGHISDYLKFNFTDNAGNTLDVKNHPKAKINVFESVTGAPSDHYTIAINRGDITSIDKQVIKYLTTPVYYYTIPFKLNYNKNCAGDDVEAIDIRLDGDCKTGATINYIPQGKSYSGFLQFAIDKSQFSESWKQTDIGVASPCSLKFSARCSTRIYAAPETEEVKFNIPIIDSDEVGDEVIREIEYIKDDISKFDTVMAKLNKIFDISKGICTIKGVFGSVLTVFSIMGHSAGVCIDSQAGRIISLGGCDAAEEGAKAGHIATSLSFEGLSNLLDGFCNFATCRGEEVKLPIAKKPIKFGGGLCDTLKTSVSKGIDNLVGTAASDGQSRVISSPFAAGALDALTKQNERYFDMDTLKFAKESYLFAVGCACIPAIIYNYDKWQQIKCMKAVCLRDMIPLGVPKEECEKQDQYNRCRYLVGQAGIPSIIEMVLLAPIRKVLDMLSNPVAASYMLFRRKTEVECIRYCQDAGPPADPTIVVPRSPSCALNWHTWCGGYAAIVLMEAVLDTSHFARTADTIFKPEVDYCERLKKGENEQTA